MSQELEAMYNALQQVALTDNLSQTARQNQLLSEIKELAGDATTGDSSFQAIKVTLEEIDGELEGVKTTSGNPLDKYAPRWAELRTKWNNLFGAARDNAVHIAAFIEAFQPILNEVDNLTKEQGEEKYEEMYKQATRHIKELTEENNPEQGGDFATKVKTAQTHSESFRELGHYEVESFKREVTLLVSREMLKENEEFDELKRQVKGLEEEIEKSSGMTYEIGQFLDKLPVKEVSDGISNLSEYRMGPQTVLKTMAQGLKAAAKAKDELVTGSVKGVNDKIAEKNQKTARMEQIGRQLEMLLRVQGKLTDHDDDFDEIRRRLLPFSNFWTLIWQSVKLLSISLEDARTTKTDWVLRKRVGGIKPEMSHLANACTEYITQANCVKFT